MCIILTYLVSRIYCSSLNDALSSSVSKDLLTCPGLMCPSMNIY